MTFLKKIKVSFALIQKKLENEEEDKITELSQKDN